MNSGFITSTAVLGILHLLHQIGALIEEKLLPRRLRSRRANLNGREERPTYLVVPLILCPAFERMIVTLRTHHANAQEDLSGLLHRRLGFASYARKNSPLGMPS